MKLKKHNFSLPSVSHLLGKHMRVNLNDIYSAELELKCQTDGVTNINLMQSTAYLTHIICTCVESVCVGVCQYIPEEVGKQRYYASRIK